MPIGSYVLTAHISMTVRLWATTQSLLKATFCFIFILSVFIHEFTYVRQTHAEGLHGFLG